MLFAQLVHRLDDRFSLKADRTLGVLGLKGLLTLGLETLNLLPIQLPISFVWRRRAGPARWIQADRRGRWLAWRRRCGRDHLPPVTAGRGGDAFRFLEYWAAENAAPIAPRINITTIAPMVCDCPPRASPPKTVAIRKHRIVPPSKSGETSGGSSLAGRLPAAETLSDASFTRTITTVMLSGPPRRFARSTSTRAACSSGRQSISVPISSSSDLASQSVAANQETVARFDRKRTLDVESQPMGLGRAIA